MKMLKTLTERFKGHIPLSEMAQRLQERRTQVLLWGIAVAASAFLAFCWDYKTPEPHSQRPRAEDPETAATYIPAGFVLVPIEVANYESLDSILGKFGVVDLYQPSDDPKSRPNKVAERVKILRAPLNPSHFAVLVPESQSQRLVRFTGAFMVVIQNPSRAGTRFETNGKDATDATKKAETETQNKTTLKLSDRSADTREDEESQTSLNGVGSQANSSYDSSHSHLDDPPSDSFTAKKTKRRNRSRITVEVNDANPS